VQFPGPADNRRQTRDWMPRSRALPASTSLYLDPDGDRRGLTGGG